MSVFLSLKYMHFISASIKLIFIACVVQITFLSSLFGQQEEKSIHFETDFWGYADNREYKTPNTVDQTIIGARISPAFHFSLDEHHHLYGGIHYQKDFGSRNQDLVHPIAYYNYKSDKIDFYIGHTPRLVLLEDLHYAALSSTFLYDRPNVEGLLFHYHGKRLNQKLFIDWTSKQSEEDREQFIVGWTGKSQFGSFFLHNDAVLWHNALRKNSDPDEHIRDNAMVMIRPGYDFSSLTGLDVFNLDAGILVGIDRIRSEYDFRFTKGFISNLEMKWKSYLLKNTLYMGEGNALPLADPYYYSKTYNRTDLGWIPFKNQAVEAQLLLSFHAAPGHFDNQQFFKLKYHFGQKLF